ncbi:MAG: DegT/DnrJ/EryC1/StrS family aminotransferase [Leptospirales bacterium]|nr:DegT/DnrJ/EryC1/StrS family aminotransferase [Leptospirales bacterium]
MHSSVGVPYPQAPRKAVVERRVRKKSLPYARPDISSLEREAVDRVLRSGWLTSGPEVHAFEDEFARAVGADFAIAVNSATAGLHLAMEVLGIGTGDLVLVPSITFTATAEAVLYAGAQPHIVDVDRSTYLMDPQIVLNFIKEECELRERKVIHKASGKILRALIPVHLGGRPCDLEGLQAIADKYDLHIVEDAAHAFPTRYKNRMIGNVSEITAFSFYATKNLSTGEGGMVTTNSDKIANRLKRLRLHGIKGQTWGRKRWKYDVVEQGYKYNMTDLAAAMGRVQLMRTAEMQERRHAIASRYRDAFQDIKGIQIVKDPEGSSQHLFTIEIAPAAKMSRDRFVEEMYARGIGTSLHFIPLYRHTFYKEMGYEPGNFPASEDIYKRIVSLPLYSSMSDDDVEDVVFAVQETFESQK